MIDKCPYCGSDVEFVNSTKVYRQDYGMIYLCTNYPLCDARVGVHKGTNKPFGRMANRELRNWKRKTHMHFDPFWNYLLDTNQLNKKTNEPYKKHEARNSVYDWLASELDIGINDCHIGMFDIEQCQKIIQICKDLYDKHPRLKQCFKKFNN